MQPPTWEQGRTHRLAGNPAEAVRLLRQAPASEANDYRFHDELGMALVDLGRQEEAIGSFMAALKRKPDFDEACNKIGSAFASRGLFEPAAVWFLQAREMNPAATKYLYTYGCVLTLLDSHKQAAELFDDWLKAEPDNPVARHLAGAALGNQSITSASPDYVRVLFDRYADHFDESLARLHYCGPDLVFRALIQVVSPPASGLDILDAGCGTGLVGVTVKPVARRLIGVDLSARMLKIARTRATYDDLVEADVVEYLGDHPREFDAVIAADVAPYLGDLAAFFANSALAIRSGGALVLAAEALTTGDNFRLNLNGRFSHSRDYLQKTMEQSGFAVAHLAEDTMRHEAKKPVPTWVAVGKRHGHEYAAVEPPPVENIRSLV